MKVCVVGAGSIGGLLGVKLAAAGHEVSLVARGAHLEAIQSDGLQLVMNDGSYHVAKNVVATDDMTTLGPQDLVVLGVKAHQIAPIVDELESLNGPETAILTTQNGIPWWYFQRLGGPYEGYTIKTLDPGGRLSRRIDSSRLIGCIAYPAAYIARPGVIHHVEGTRFPIGELDFSLSPRLERISEALVGAGFKSHVLEDIRSEIWLKALGNLAFNPISALSHATLEDICQFPPSRELATKMMEEAKAVAKKLGATIRIPLEKRIQGAERVGKHKTSMLQDVEAGKNLEIDALVGAVVELGELTEIPTPHIKAICAAVQLLAKVLKSEKVCIKAQPVPAPAPAPAIAVA